jgi:hypothetical protein
LSASAVYAISAARHSYRATMIRSRFAASTGNRIRWLPEVSGRLGVLARTWHQPNAVEGQAAQSAAPAARRAPPTAARSSSSDQPDRPTTAPRHATPHRRRQRTPRQTDDYE